MTEAVVVQVPFEERDELQKLIVNANQPDQEVVTSHAFDGATVAEVVLTLSGTAAPILIVWIKARAEIRKKSKVIIRGAEFSGYGANEVRRIIAQIEGVSRERGDR